MADTLKEAEETAELSQTQGQSQHLAKDAQFRGSFAPGTRPTVISPVPWYRDREYFLGGWSSASIWRSAVSFSVARWKRLEKA
jgi:hypothetical protein